MFRGINKILTAGIIIVAVQPALSMEIYTVKANDYLYKIAKNHSLSGIGTSEMTDAIKGINKSEIPEIAENRIKIGDKLALPTTRSEVEDGLTLTRNQMIHNSYDQVATNKPDSQAENATYSQSSVESQDKVPSLVPIDDSDLTTYKKDLNSQISATNIVESGSSDGYGIGAFFGLLFRLIVYIAIFAAIFFVARKFWNNRNSKKELELELISKKKRDHLMSRISPVVSDDDFYRSETASRGPQEEFDFFCNSSSLNSSVLESEKDHVESGNTFVHSESSDSPSCNEQGIYEKDKNIAIKTEKGVVFEANTDESLVGQTDDENQVEEVDSQHQMEQELQYINELVEQFLDSEKYVEASITIQDCLEKNPNNIELRYQLLEVYAQAGDEIAFEGEVHFIKSKNIVSMFDPLHQKIAKLRDKYFE